MTLSAAFMIGLAFDEVGKEEKGDNHDDDNDVIFIGATVITPSPLPQIDRHKNVNTFMRRNENV